MTQFLAHKTLKINLLFYLDEILSSVLLQCLVSHTCESQIKEMGINLKNGKHRLNTLIYKITRSHSKDTSSQMLNVFSNLSFIDLEKFYIHILVK